jgi:hypothetical protein
VKTPSPGWWLLPTLVLTLALGCAAQYEEPAGTAPDNAREQVGTPEAAAMEPTAVERPERSLDDFRLELASNEAKLRALGVELPSRTVTGGDADLGNAEFGGEKTEKYAPEPTGSGGAGTTATPEDVRPTTAPRPEPVAPGKGVKSGPTKQGRRDAKKKTEDTAGSDRFTQPPPDEAKATPLTPTEQPQLDAATRCIQVCELSEITCELGVQICELAQRHAGDQDYEQACARATEDCDAAQEACDVCAG